MSNKPPFSVTEVLELLRGNLCHGNCICSDDPWCIQQIAAQRIEALAAALRRIAVVIIRDYDNTPALTEIHKIAEVALAPEDNNVKTK